MDSALDVSRVEGCRPIPPNLRLKGVKLDSNFGKPPTVFTRITSKVFILKKCSMSSQDDQLISMSPLKRNRSDCELKSCSLNELSDPPTPNSISSHVEDEVEVPHSGKMESENATGGLLEKVPEDPPLEKENPKVFSAATVFQQAK
ncbi:unnamed protein product [Lactuca virosa]|uniref:Uncharacterized protein n=1 Tax=Lactuca virosa TaxID=75947 RepID=A0AAU9NQF6_9ASTR|nr:unnamed protein product [Lactuca virosa]